ncbi:MAG: hypothetical protein V1494_01025 [Candidatus Diapherotrites archaeon]
MKTFNSKGQAIAVDLVIATIIFAIIVFTLLGIGEENVGAINEKVELNEIHSRAEGALMQLVEGNGNPENWEGIPAAQVQEIGLAEKRLEVDEKKLNALKNFGYDGARTLLEINPYDFFFDVNALSGEYVFAGLPPIADATIVSIKRAVTYKGGEAVATIKVYRAK